MNARTFAIARAVAVIGGTSALIVGGTFAATTTNSVTAAGQVQVSDNLSISADNQNYGPSASGFLFKTSPGSPTMQPVDLWMQTTEPSGTVDLSAAITHWDTNLSAEASHLTAVFTLGSNTVNVPFSDLGTGDQSLAGLGALGSGPNDVKLAIKADPTTPDLNALNGVTFQFTGTNDGTVSH